MSLEKLIYDNIDKLIFETDQLYKHDAIIYDQAYTDLLTITSTYNLVKEEVDNSHRFLLSKIKDLSQDTMFDLHNDLKKYNEKYKKHLKITISL